MIMPIHASGGLCGICSDGKRVYCTDIDLHKVHVLRLSKERRRTAAQAARDMEEAQLREQLQAGGSTGKGKATTAGGGGGATASDPTAANGEEDDAEVLAEIEAAAAARKAKEQQRDLALKRVLSAPVGARVHRVLGLRADAPKAELTQATRLAMRLLHPDRSMNLPLQGSAKGRQLVAAFKRVNNLSDEL